MGFTMTDAEKGLPVYEEEEVGPKAAALGRGRNLDSVWAECRDVCTTAVTHTGEDEDEGEDEGASDLTSDGPSCLSFVLLDRDVKTGVLNCSWLTKCIALATPTVSTISLREYTMMAVSLPPHPSTWLRPVSLLGLAAVLDLVESLDTCRSVASNTSFSMLGSAIDASIILSFSARILLESLESPACDYLKYGMRCHCRSSCEQVGSRMSRKYSASEVDTSVSRSNEWRKSALCDCTMFFCVI